MKKIIFTLSALCIVGAVFAQVTFGIKAGPDFSTYATKYYGSEKKGKMITGLSGGVYANLPMGPKIYVQSSLMYEGKGGEVKGLGTKVRLNYLTLPVNFLFKPKMYQGNGFWIIGIGGYIGYGLSGKTQFDYSVDSTSIFVNNITPFKSSYSSNPALLKRLDAGADAQLGYEMSNGFNIRLNTEFGLLNIASNGGDASYFRNISFSVKVGYTLKKPGDNHRRRTQ